MPDRRSDDERSQDRFREMARVAKRSQAFGSSVITAVALIVAIITTGVSIWNVTELHELHDDTRQLLKNDLPIAAALQVEKVLKDREREFGTASVQCLIEQLSEHRHLTAVAHRAAASQHGYSYPVPPEEEPPPVSDADTVCAQFFKTERK